MHWMLGIALLQGGTTDFIDEGWRVHVEPALISTRPNLWRAVKAELDCQLIQIGRVVPAGPLAKLRTVPIWVSLDNPLNKGAMFHPDPGWLRDHHLNPEMAHGLEIGNAEDFVTWTHEQPWMVLHELSHAYHYLFLPMSFRNPDIKAAYDAAMAAHRYDNVLCYDGAKRKAYACTNEMEFFAEMTESYFGTNDYYPFVRGELMTYDPATYALMMKMWGAPARSAPAG